MDRRAPQVVHQLQRRQQAGQPLGVLGMLGRERTRIDRLARLEPGQVALDQLRQGGVPGG